MTTRRRRSRRRTIHPGVLFFILFMICGIVATPGAQVLGAWALLAAVVSTRVARRLVIVTLCLVGLVGIFLLVWAAYRRRHTGPWGALHDERAPWRGYLHDAPPPRRRRPPAQRYVTRPLPAAPPPAPRDPWSAPTVRLSRSAVAR